jgi:hypothetical protein
MRTSVEEVSGDIGRWVARLHNRWGTVVCYAFSNKSADDAEDCLIWKIGHATSICEADNCNDCKTEKCVVL